MEKVYIAVKYDIEFKELCHVDYFLKHIDTLSDMCSDAIVEHADDGSQYTLDADALVDCYMIAVDTGNDELAAFITQMLNLKPVNNNQIVIEIY